MATLADASELPTTVTVAQVNYSAVTDGEVRTCVVSRGRKPASSYPTFSSVTDFLEKSPPGFPALQWWGLT